MDSSFLAPNPNRHIGLVG